jgi:putative PIN family toxin of toxin-antitoxin system
MPTLPIVLDTNVVLDVFHFQDKTAVPLAEAIATGRLLCLSDATSLEELRRVLAYPKLSIAPEQARAILERYRALTHLIPGHGSPFPLPLCRDPDDQTFLELAARGGAQWLISKDKEVLRLRKNRQPSPFAILTPCEVSARLATEI